MKKDNNNKILEKYLPASSSISGFLIPLAIFSLPILIVTFLINGFSALMLLALIPIPFLLNSNFDSKEKREKYIHLVRSQEEYFSVEFSDVGIERIGNTVNISYNWIISSEYALYKDYVSDIRYEEKVERILTNLKYNIKTKVTKYYITIKTIDNTEYQFSVAERYQAERMLTWLERKKHERNN